MSARIEPICTIELPTGEEVPVVRRRFGGAEGPRVAIVAGVRGDTPEGTRILHTVGRHLAQVDGELRGTVDLFPCVNPLAAHHGARNWPGFDLDLSTRFPGRHDGHAPDRVAAALLAAVSGFEQVVELRGAHPAFRQAAQARVRADREVALERAGACNARVVWKRAGVGDPGSLSDVVADLIGLEGGVGNRLTEGVALELSDGVLNLLCMMGILPEERLPFHWAAIQRPAVAEEEEVLEVRATRGGLYLPAGSVWDEVEVGSTLGEVVDPLTGEVREALTAHAAGRILAQREQPVVYPGNLVARLVVA